MGPDPDHPATLNAILLVAVAPRAWCDDNRMVMLPQMLVAILGLLDHALATLAVLGFSRTSVASSVIGVMLPAYGKAGFGDALASSSTGSGSSALGLEFLLLLFFGIIGVRRGSLALGGSSVNSVGLLGWLAHCEGVWRLF